MSSLARCLPAALCLLFSCLPARGQGIITTVAGTESIFNGDGLPALQAPLGVVRGVAVDRSGNLFLTDSDNSMVMKVGSDGILRVLAGNGIEAFSGDGGPATSASMLLPVDVTVDAAGNVYFADYFNNRVRRVDNAGIISTVAGTGEAGFSGDGRPATQARIALGVPGGLATDAAGNLYISDTRNNRIRRVTPDGIITTVVGDGRPIFSGDGGAASRASLWQPKGVTLDAQGTLYFSDSGNNRIRKVTPDGIIATVAGNGDPGFFGDGGPATGAIIASPAGIAIDPAGTLYFFDSGNGRVRKVTPDGIILTVAGNGEAGFSGDGGPATSARLSAGGSGVVAVDRTGNLYIADVFNLRVRRVTADGIISTVAGVGPTAPAGDGGPATSAVFYVPTGIAVDSAGSLYICENTRNRVRKVSPDGTVRLVAGNGEAGFSGDGGPATLASFSSPYKVAVDRDGNLFIGDRGNHRIRKVTPDGIISTVAGNGKGAFSGDGGPATGASLNFAAAAAADTAGNLYIADTANGRIRKVTPDGIITTVAGGGAPGSLGDGGPAASAFLAGPANVAVDDAGNLYISDGSGNRVRKVNSQGIISTLAGTGQPSFSGDGGPAARASLATPLGLFVDRLGNVFIADSFNQRIRKVTPDGIISTVAGNGSPGFSGDGGPATAARLNSPYDVVLSPAGNLYIPDTSNARVRAVLAPAPSFTLSAAGLSFAARSGGLTTGEQRLTLSPSTPGLLFSVAVSTTAGGDWLRVTPTEGGMPTTIQATADPSALAPGTYSGTITVTAPNAAPAVRTAAVTFVVDAPVPPRLGAKPDALSFSFVERSPRATQTLTISNEGGGSVAFTAVASTSSGGGWLSVSPGGGTVTPAAALALTVAANPAGLAPGTYSGRITLAAAGTGQTLLLPATMTVSALPATILLSQTGLTFTAVANGGEVPSQSFGVLNVGDGVMRWSASASTLSGGLNWLSVKPASGTSTALSLNVPLADVGVSAAGLAAGEYYGQIQVSAAEAGNSPQFISVVLNVLPAGSNPGPLVRPTGLIFTGVAGANSPGSQDVLISNLTSRSVNYVAGRLTSDGQNWFIHAPTSATVTPQSPLRVVVQTDLTGLSAGIRRGVLTLLFQEDGAIRNVNLLLVLIPGSAARQSSSPVLQSACTPAKLLPLFTLLPDNFNVPAAWPSPVEVRVVDDCANPLVAGSVVATFSNGDPVLPLASLGDGRWAGTWQPRNTRTSQVTVTATAEHPKLSIRGTAQTTGALLANLNPPVVGSGAVVNAASYAPQAPLAPGSLVSIFGSKLAEGSGAAPSLPLATQLAGSSVTIAGRPLPLLFASEQQINAMVPYDIAVNTRHQLVVRRGSSYAVPEAVTVAEAQPAIFTNNQTGTGQGVIVDVSNRYLEPGNPAKAGDAVVIYCSGLGVVDPLVPAGTAAPSSPLSRTTNLVSLTIGGVQAQVFFAGLTPGFSGLYQVNALVPAGVAPGNEVPVVLMVAGQTSPPVTMAVR